MPQYRPPLPPRDNKVVRLVAYNLHLEERVLCTGTTEGMISARNFNPASPGVVVISLDPTTSLMDFYNRA